MIVINVLGRWEISCAQTVRRWLLIAGLRAKCPYVGSILTQKTPRCTQVLCTDTSALETAMLTWCNSSNGRLRVYRWRRKRFNDLHTLKKKQRIHHWQIITSPFFHGLPYHQIVHPLSTCGVILDNALHVINRPITPGNLNVSGSGSGIEYCKMLFEGWPGLW